MTYPFYRKGSKDENFLTRKKILKSNLHLYTQYSYNDIMGLEQSAGTTEDPGIIKEANLASIYTDLFGEAVLLRR